MNIEQEAIKIVAKMQHQKRTRQTRTCTLVWGPSTTQNKEPGFRVVPSDDNRSYLLGEHNAWRIVGIYRLDVGLDVIQEDLAWWVKENFAHVAMGETA